MDAADFINKCLARKANHRLGNNGNAEAKAHAWFADFDWQALVDGRMTPSYIPDSNNVNFDENHVNNQEWKDAEAVKENEVHLMNPTTQQLFKGYYFDKTHQNNHSNNMNHATINKSTTGGNEFADTEGGIGQKSTSLLKTTKNIQIGPSASVNYPLNGTPSFNKDGINS